MDEKLLYVDIWFRLGIRELLTHHMHELLMHRLGIRELLSHGHALTTNA